MSSNEFTRDEISYLRSLRAVARVMNGRIRYTEEFKRSCLRRYKAGESPAKIFRDAGLDSSLIGYKRIEGCIARWKNDTKLLESIEAEPESDGTDQDELSERATRRQKVVAGVGADESIFKDSPEYAGLPSVAFRDGIGPDNAQLERLAFSPKLNIHAGRRDLRDLLIAQLVRRIDDLESEISYLQAKCDAAEKAASASSPASVAGAKE